MQKSALKMPKVIICTTSCKEKLPFLPEVIQVFVYISFCEKVASYPVEEVWFRLGRETEREKIKMLEKGIEIKN